MQFRLPMAVAVFTGSYLPLAAILLVQDINYAFFGQHICWPPSNRFPTCIIPLRHPVISITALVVSLFCLLATVGILRSVHAKNAIDITEARYIPADLINYTLPYIVSFMAIGYDDVGKVLGLLLFMGWMFWIVNRSGQLILNPVLVVFGWRLYDVEYSFPGDKKTRGSQALVKGLIQAGAQYKQASLQDVLIIQSGST